MMDTYSADWVLSQSSTTYMDGTTVYYVRLPRLAGHVTSLRLDDLQAKKLREVIAACLAERV